MSCSNEPVAVTGAPVDNIDDGDCVVKHDECAKKEHRVTGSLSQTLLNLPRNSQVVNMKSFCFRAPFLDLLYK